MTINEDSAKNLKFLL
jgi:hypothetical protein